MEHDGMPMTADDGLDDWRAHLSPAETRPAGTEILPQATVPDRVYLSDGIAKVRARGLDALAGHGRAPFPGWLLGAESVIARQRAPVSVVAVTGPLCPIRSAWLAKFRRYPSAVCGRSQSAARAEVLAEPPSPRSASDSPDSCVGERQRATSR